MPNPDSITTIREAKGCCAPRRIDDDLSGNGAAPESPSTQVAASDLKRMVRLPGGTFLMGTDALDAFADDGEGPVRAIKLRPFLLDRYTVTNRLFEGFVCATGFRTDAERYGWSFVFWNNVCDGRVAEDSVHAAPWWYKVPGATWSSPEGPGSNISLREEHPVVHVSHNDACAYASWSGQRLPTEAEWEYAARGGLSQNIYPWGNKLRPGGEHRCNIWQGNFPHQDDGDDGYTGTCPVDAFPGNGFGLFSMTGNTWEWCSDWFSTNHHQMAAQRDNPSGPPTGDGRVLKGGSFLCHRSYCNRYRVAARTFNTPDSSTSHMSFRCAADA